MAVDDEVTGRYVGAGEWKAKPSLVKSTQNQSGNAVEPGYPVLLPKSHVLGPGPPPPPCGHVVGPGLFPDPAKAGLAESQQEAGEKEALHDGSPHGLGGRVEEKEYEQEAEVATDESDDDEEGELDQAVRDMASAAAEGAAAQVPTGFAPMGAGQVRASSTAAPERQSAGEAAGDCAAASQAQEVTFSMEETVLIFDWDDTVLPSTWVQGQGLRLDEGSEVSAWQREQLAEVANVAAETLRIAKQHGTVVIVTNAERGWIELSCQKFMPTLYPTLENIKVLSARTTYECPQRSAPLDWKLAAFGSEIHRIFGVDALECPERRKNVLSLGDSVHEREALLRATKDKPNCRSKSLKFVERPDIGQIVKQHSLVTSCFERIVHHDGHLDLCIRCT